MMTPASTLTLRVLPRLGKSWRRWTNRHDLRQTRALIPFILAELPVSPALPDPVTWQINRLEWTLTSTIVAEVGPHNGSPAIVLKLPKTKAGIASLDQQAHALSRLHADVRLLNWKRFLPQPLARGERDGQVYFAESAVPGLEGRLLLHNPALSNRLHEIAAAEIAFLHERTAIPMVVDAAHLSRWVINPFRRIQAVCSLYTDLQAYDQTITRAVSLLRERLSGRDLTVGWIHGDFWTSNILAADNGMLTGIVDWDRAVPDDLPIFDRLHLVVQRRKLIARESESGHAICALLSPENWTPVERALLDRDQLAAFGDDGLWTALMLYWLHFIVLYLDQAPTRARDAAWVANSIEVVLRCISTRLQ